MDVLQMTDLEIKVLSNLLPEIKFHRIDKQNGHLLFDTPDGIVPLHCLSDGYLADDLRAAQVGILKKASSGNALKLLGPHRTHFRPDRLCTYLRQNPHDRHDPQSHETLGGERKRAHQRLLP